MNQPQSLQNEMIRQLQNLVQLAQQGRLVALVVCGMGPDGSTINMMMVPDPATPNINTALDSVKAKLISNFMRMEQQGKISPILKPVVGMTS